MPAMQGKGERKHFSPSLSIDVSFSVKERKNWEGARDCIIQQYQVKCGLVDHFFTSDSERGSGELNTVITRGENVVPLR
jgi:hypothetical protein